MILTKAKFEKVTRMKTKQNLVFSIKDEISQIEVDQLIMGEGWLAFNPDEYRAKVLAVIANKRIGVQDTGLTFSERLRKVLFLVSEEKGVDFETFYSEEMAKIIEHYKYKYL